MVVKQTIKTAKLTVTDSPARTKERLKKMLDIFIEGAHYSNPSLLALNYVVFKRGK